MGFPFGHAVFTPPGIDPGTLRRYVPPPMNGALAFGLTAFTSLFAIVDPFAALPVYLALTGRESPAHRRQTARRASLTTLTVLVVFALSGQIVFQFFGISIGAFKIAGGVLLMFVAFDMMKAQVSSTKSTPQEAQDAATREDVGLMPVGIPLLSGPGAIASSMVLSARAQGMNEKGALLVAMVLVAFVTWLVLRSASGIARVLGLTGMNIIARVMGLILAAVAVQFVVDGMLASFPVLMRHG